MNKMTIAAIVVAAGLLIAGAYVAVTMGNIPGKEGPAGVDDEDNGRPDAVTSANKTLAVSFPREVASNDRKMALSMVYPGKGESGHTYNWSEYYRFGLNAAPASGYTGNVLIKMFAEKEKEIGPTNLLVKDFEGKQVEWSFATKSGAHSLYNVISGDIVAWRTDGSSSSRSFDVLFNGTGNYSLFIQAFDLDSGKAISDPVSATPLYVPVTGHLTVKALTRDEWMNTTNGTYLVILMNITNDWNIRYDVHGSFLVLRNGTVERTANTSAGAFKEQSLAPRQSTQFNAWFDFTVQDRSSFVLQYRDEHSGEVYNVPLCTMT